ncbi:MAG: hypothetical protein FWH27_19135 [Planctomycetaceae bacterium]|nr:hypothetical protein [Planctomycetaceae bacterium]
MGVERRANVTLKRPGRCEFRVLSEKNQWTSTRKPILRLLYFAPAMLMRNCRIWFERVCVTENGRRQ